MTAVPRRLVVASHNAGKVREIAALLAPFGFDVVSAGELGLPEPEEIGNTFVDKMSGPTMTVPVMCVLAALCVAATGLAVAF